jgi:hypothetical protein
LGAPEVAVRLGHLGRPVAGRAECADPRRQPEQAPYVVVDDRFRHLAGLDRGHERVAPRSAGSGHHQVEAAVRGRSGGLGREPVRHQQTGPAPLTLEDPVVDRVLLSGGRAVDVVVRRHHRPRIGIGDGDLERQQVQLAHRALVDPAVHRVPVGLGLVADQVFETGTDPA